MHPYRDLAYVPVILCAILFCTLASWTIGKGYGDPCLRAINPQICFSEETGAVIKKGGVRKGLEFAKDVVAVQGDYPAVHNAMHTVGKEAYLESSDIGKALTYLPAPSAILDDFFFYNGFQHGAFEEYFRAHGNEASGRLVEEACKSYADPSDPSRLRESILADECVHATGHALMSISGNDVRASLKLCDSLPSPWMDGWCAHGVFMENYYLMNPAYPGDPPRPDARTGSILALCDSVRPRYQVWCHQFVGWSYLAVHHADFSGAFQECMTLPRIDARICIARAARLFSTKTYGSDFAKMRDVCDLAGDYVKECLYGTAIGIHEGAAGEALRSADFCGSIPESLQAGCVDAVSRSDDSLARMYVTEL